VVVRDRIIQRALRRLCLVLADTHGVSVLWKREASERGQRASISLRQRFRLRKRPSDSRT
jgi:hypothetical protein